jgi:pyroglutamyl-peptidase
MMDRKCVLVTGFEPFGGSLVNPSQRVVEHLAAERWTTLNLQTAILPVDGRAGPARLLQLVNALCPDVVLCLGEARRRAAISIERVALNLMDYRIADNAGQMVTDEPVVAGGPAAYFVTLPVRRMQMAVQAAGVPVELSLSAGAYLCNQVLYTLLHRLDGSTAWGGFIHLPALPEQVASGGETIPSMSLEISLRAVVAILDELQEILREDELIGA